MSISQALIDQFIEVTDANRRVACYFLSHNRSNVNDAVMAFFDLGADSVPPEYVEPGQPPPSTPPQTNSDNQPSMPEINRRISSSSSSSDFSDHSDSLPSDVNTLLDGASDFLREHGEFLEFLREALHSSNSSHQDQPQQPPSSPPPSQSVPKSESASEDEDSSSSSLPDFKETIEDSINIPHSTFETNPRYAFLKEVPSNVEEEKKEKENTPLPKRINVSESAILTIWKNGYSLGDEFVQLEGNEYQSFMKAIKSGNVPEEITVKDIELVNRSKEEHK